VKLERWKGPSGDVIPNHPRFDVLVYRGVELDDPRGLFAAHGWGVARG